VSSVEKTTLQTLSQAILGLAHAISPQRPTSVPAEYFTPRSTLDIPVPAGAKPPRGVASHNGTNEVLPNPRDIED